MAEITIRIEAMLPGFDGKRLPPVRELGRHFSVSTHTVAKALRRLARAGKVSLRPRSRALAGAPPGPGPRPEPTGRDALYESLRRKITYGDYSTGQPLPKVLHLTRAFRVSDHTVRWAYRRLVEEGLAHRQGRARLVGPAPARARGPSSPGAVILILTPTPNAWQGLCTASRTEQFGHAFVREAQRHNFGLKLALMRRQAVAGAQPFLLDRDAIREFAGHGSSNYIGALIVGLRTEVPDLDAWIGFLLGFRKPVVWFDRNDEGLGGPVRSPLFTRCRFDEDSACAAAISHLARHGHRAALYPRVEQHDWQDARGERLVAAGASHDPPVTVVRRRVAMAKDWSPPVPGELLAGLRELQGAARGPLARAFRHFAAHSRGLLRRFDPERRFAPMGGELGGYLAFTAARLADRRGEFAEEDRAYGAMIASALALRPLLGTGPARPTALIAPSDDLAKWIHLNWLGDVGLAVPDQVSVVSFDNKFRFTFMPLTTVDFGFDALGYQAFHAILRDVPVNRDRHGVISARAQVVDRGTVRAPNANGTSFLADG